MVAGAASRPNSVAWSPLAKVGGLGKGVNNTSDQVTLLPSGRDRSSGPTQGTACPTPEHFPALRDTAKGCLDTMPGRCPPCCAKGQGTSALWH